MGLRDVAPHPFPVFITSKSTGYPVAGVKVQVYDPTGKLIGTATTDENGFYQVTYKYTGTRPATFTLKLPDYNLQQSATLKPKGFVTVNFQVP